MNPPLSTILGHTRSEDGESLLARSSLVSQPVQTPLQAQVDGLVGGFAEQATDWRSLAAMMAGGMAYRFGRIGVMASGVRGGRLLSLGVGLGTEVATFEMAQRSLTSLTGEGSQNPNLWRWSGQGGIRQGLLNSLITFGSLKGAGRLAQGENFVIQHLLQDTGMVLGHQVSGAFGITDRPQGTLAEQFFHAEATNLQLGAGMALAHSITPGIQGLERGLDLSLRLVDPRSDQAPRQMGLTPAFAMAGSGPSSSKGSAEGRPSGEVRVPLILAMASIHPTEAGGSKQSGGGSSPPPPSSRYAELLLKRAASLSSSSLSETVESLRGEWDEWTRDLENAFDEKGRGRMEALLPHYARFAMAHLGKETPAQLPFIQEVYEMAAASFLAEGREPLTEGERSLLIRFLSEQPGRRKAGEGGPVSSLPENLLSFERTRNLLGERQRQWEEFLRGEIDRSGLLPSERAQAYQRGLALMHFYAARLHRERGEDAFTPVSRLPFDPQVLQQCLAETAQHPYPSLTLETFVRFFRKVLGQRGSGTFPIPSLAGRGTAREEMEPLEASAPPFLELEPGETWPEHLTRAGITRGQLDAADLSVAGATIFAYGSRRDSQKALSAPGDILPFHGVVTYLNARREKGIDPYHAIRLSLPEQLSGFEPDAQGNIVIRFPKLMAGLDYAHFGLGALLRAHLQTTPEAHDMDLARQWGVHESTVSEYRRGIVRKMRLATLERLVEGLAPSDASDAQKTEIRNLLMFLRYRPYFDANLAIVDQDGNTLNRRPPLPSRYRIVLAPTEDGLRPLDLTRRVRFEREPFASALNGTVDLSLDLLETRRREFEILNMPMQLAEGDLSQEAFAQKIQAFRERHALFFQKLSEQGRSPSVVRPGELREIQDFYRDIFRFFEKIHLHTRPAGEISVGGVSVPYEIVPPTLEQPRGVRFEADPESPNGVKAFVVAADLVENGREISNETLRDLFNLRVAKAYLRSMNLLLPGEEHASANDEVLQKSLLSLSRSGEGEWTDLTPVFEDLETRSEAWSAPIINPSEQAFLHRILRGRVSEGAAERRTFLLQEDLRNYATREGAISFLPDLQAALDFYLNQASHPTLRFDREAFEAALLPCLAQEPEGASLVRDHLIAFLKSLGFPAGDNGSASPSVTAEGLANLSFSGYLAYFRENHPLRWQGQLIEDPVLLERLVDERLVDAPQLASHRDRILTEMKRLVAEYNRRTPPLRILEIAAQSAYPQDPLVNHPLNRIYDETLAGLQEKGGGIFSLDSRRLIYTSFRGLRETLARGERPSSEQIEQSFQEGLRRLEEVGISIPPDHHFHHLTLLTRLVEGTHLSLQSIDRLMPSIKNFVRSHDYHSGLDDAHDLSLEVERIFRRHFSSALLDAEPFGLPAAIAAEIQGRFGPFPTIREDLVRGLKIIYHETLQSLRDHYDQLSLGVEMSREEARSHGDLERFRNDLLGLAREAFPDLRDFNDLTRRAEDLEVLLSLLPNSPQVSFSDRLRTAEGGISLQDVLKTAHSASMSSRPPAPIHAEPPPAPAELPPPAPLPLDPTRILSAQISPHLLDRYPELDHVQETALAAEITEGRRHVVEGEGRSVLQLIALLNGHRESLSPESRQVLDQMILEVETSPESIDRITEEAFSRYDSIREDLIGQLPVLDRVGLLPELRMEGKILQGAEAGQALQNFLSRRRYSSSSLRMLERVLEAHFEGLQRGDLLPYLEDLSRFYLENRETFGSAPELRIAETDANLLDPLNPPEHLKTRLRREAPELDLFEDTNLQEALEEARNLSRGIASDFWSQSGSYLLLKLRCLLSTQFSSLPANSPLIGIGSQFLTDHRHLTAWAAAGGSLPHLAALGTEQMMERYRQHRPLILNHLTEREGVEQLLQLFPETRNSFHPVLPSTWEGLDAPLPVLPQFEIAARIANRLLFGSVNLRHRRAIEQILSNLIPPTEGAAAEVADEALRRTAEALMTYYLKNREDLRSAGSDRAQATLESIREADKSAAVPLWEMAAYPDPETAIQERRERIQTFLREPWGGEMRYLFRFMGPEGDLHERILSEGDVRQVQEAFDIGRGVNLGTHGDWELTSENHLGTVPMTPFNRARYILKAMLSDDMLHFNEFSLFASRGVPSLYREIDNDLSRGAGWLMLGVDPIWVLPTLRERWMKAYQRHREKVLSTLDFAASVSDLSEFQGVPSYAIDMMTNPAETQKLDEAPREAEIMLRIHALIAQSRLVSVLNQCTRLSKQIRGELSDVQARKVARFYLENRRQILSQLRPWLPEERMAHVQGLPEVQELRHKDILVNAPHLPRSFVAADPRNALVLKLVTLIYEDHVPPAIRRDADALIERAADETPLSLTQRLADFYLNEVRRLFYDDNNNDD